MVRSSYIKATRFHVHILREFQGAVDLRATDGRRKVVPQVQLGNKGNGNAEISARSDLLVLREDVCNRVGRAGRVLLEARTDAEGGGNGLHPGSQAGEA